MTWDFETDPEYQEKLDWADAFVRDEVEPLDFVVGHPMDLKNPLWQELIPPLQEKVKGEGLWATHLGPELGGPGHGQVKLALLNEILGRSRLGPTVFGCAAPDTGNMEILAHYGTPEQKRRWLEPLMNARMTSAYSMTEPHGGADPKILRTSAVLDGDEWVVNGEKWFTSNARFADFLIMFVVTDPENPPYQRASMLIVPTDTPGVEVVRHVGMGWQREDEGNEGYLRMTDARVPRENLLGERGHAFVVAQTRLGGGRIHHAMRTVGLVQRAFDMMCERAISRETQGELLSKKQLVQEMIADSWIEMEQFRLLVLRTAWRIDKYRDYKRVRVDIAAVKAAMPKVLNNVASRALQIHGSLGVTNEMPFVNMVLQSFVMGLGDGPTEVHKVTVARQLVSRYQPSPDLFPSRHLPRLRQQARQQYGDAIARARSSSSGDDG
jgi:acyl-CoA dehydrogenase